MMAAEEYLDVFQGATRSGNTVPWERLGRFTDRQTRQGEPRGNERVHTLAVLPKPATQKNSQILTAQRGCRDNRAGGCVGFSLTARMRMRGETVLPAANSFRNGLNAI